MKKLGGLRGLQHTPAATVGVGWGGQQARGLVYREGDNIVAVHVGHHEQGPVEEEIEVARMVTQCARELNRKETSCVRIDGKYCNAAAMQIRLRVVPVTHIQELAITR